MATNAAQTRRIMEIGAHSIRSFLLGVIEFRTVATRLNATTNHIADLEYVE